MRTPSFRLSRTRRPQAPAVSGAHRASLAPGAWPAPRAFPALGVPLALAALLAAGAPPAAAQGGASGGPSEERRVSLTVYNQDLGLVRDVRRLALPDGTGWLQFRDVPAQIDPTSVHLRAVDGGEIGVLEQNYRYDLVGSEKILERYLDQEVRVTLEEGRLFEGRLLSAGGGEIVLQNTQPEGGVFVLAREKVTDIQFPVLPEGLITRPTLAWLLTGGRGAERTLEVSYLTGGLNWHAEYVAVVAERDDALDLAGWVSVDNRSGASYPEASLQLVAGDIHRAAPEPRYAKGMAPRAEMLAAQGVGFEEEAFFEYHLYTLERATTILENETKQISLFEPAHCPVTKLYESNPATSGNKVRVVLETKNSSDAGLGMPLPKGIVRVYKRDSRERLQFIGEDRIDHTPRDEKVRVFIGNAFDLVVERTELDMRRLGPRDREVDVKLEVRNRKASETVTIVLQEDLYGDWTIRTCSHPYEQKSATRLEIPVTAKAGETVTVLYTVRYSS